MKTIHHASDAYIALCNAQLQVYADAEVASWVITAPIKTKRARVAAYPRRLSDAEIRQLFLNHGFVIKSGQADLKDYVFAAARALMDAVIGDKP